MILIYFLKLAIAFIIIILNGGKDIHEKNKETINAVLKIPQHLRTQWGMYKNLLNGITTVVNHGEKLNITDNFITVLQNNYCLHSIQFEKNWKLKLNQFFYKKQALCNSCWRRN